MRPRAARRILILSAGLAATLAAPVSPVAPPSLADTASAAPAAAGGEPNPALRASHEVTLVTGDVVRLDEFDDGTERTALVRPSEVSSGYHEYTSDGDSYFVPGGADRLVGTGRLDRELFNVSGLVRQGYDDAHRDSLPLIVGYTKAKVPSPNALGAAPAPAGTRGHTALPSVNALGVSETKKDAGRFWSAVAPGVSATQVHPTLADGVDRIWLDAKVRASLDKSVPQIGAPAAWARGFDGKGVTVAVLDSGIDVNHPDFAGRITAGADFTGSGDIVDRAGHGTHVASILAGSGAASDGRYRGVAPGADLMVGKVLQPDGSGSLSAVMAGMQWAASHGASIVNLSLGGPVTSGDDPLSQTVDQLSAQYGTLFVVAAGNHNPFEPGNNFVTSPGAADDALTVGSVNKNGGLANDSRRGRIGDTAVKPELVAPGVSITAARAAGTGFGDDPYYTSMSGTSMATPHAAGAAALLKEQHPDWGFTALKQALVSTTTPVANATVVRAGAGLVNVDRATAQQVRVDQGTLDMGYIERPFTPEQMNVQRELRYTNDSTSAVTLTLSTTLRDEDGEAGTDGALTVSPTTLTLAPGASAPVTVRLSATDLAASVWTGRVVATDGGSLQVGTAVGFYKQDDTVDLTFKAIDRHGAPAQATMRLATYKAEDAGRYFPDFFYLAPGETKQVMRVPEADYNLWALILTPDASGRYIEEESIVSVPRVQAKAPNPTIVLDARTARPVNLHTPKPSMIRSFAMSWWRGTPGTTNRSYDSMGVMVGDGTPEKVSVAGTERVDDAPFSVTSAFDAAPPVLTTTYGGKSLDAVWQAGPAIDGMNVHMNVADAGTATPQELVGRYFTGKVALVQEAPGVSYADQVKAVTARGARVVMLYSAQPGVFWASVGSIRTLLTLPMDQGTALHEQLRRGVPVSLTFDGQPNAPYAYDVAFTEHDAVPAQLDYTVKDTDVATVRSGIHDTGLGEHGYRIHDFISTACGCDTSLVVDYLQSAARVRTEYVSARPDIRVLPLWEYRFDLPGEYIYPRDSVSYQPGAALDDDWLKAPFSPGPANSAFVPFGQNSTSQRTGDRLHYDIAGWTDSAGHWTPKASSTTAATRLYRDGELIVPENSGLRGDVTVPPEAATYTLATDIDHDGSIFALSTHTSSVWTFRSASGEGTRLLPLVDVDYTDVRNRTGTASALDMHDSAAGSAAVSLVLHAGHQAGATASEVNTVRVWVSYDDGRTWAAAPVTKTAAGTFEARYTHPATRKTSGYVALKVSAADGDGNSLDQTLVRAYRLR